jgi:asparagine synthase (glutamine-hydrolysing)
MCGICGIVDFAGPVPRESVERMSRLLRHRGPDDSGLEARGAATLGFRRLSIIDLAGSHQPLSNEDDSLWLLFNGEIYNFKPLRKELAARGHRFKTEGDGEVVLHLYEEHGDDFLQHLNGMFAIALWDERRSRLLLARDRLGEKPLYYAWSGARLAFASEAKAFLDVPGLDLGLDVSAVVGFLNYGFVPGPATCLRGVRRLLPGHRAIFDASGFRSEPWWDVPLETPPLREDSGAIEKTIEELLRDSVRMRMVSDVPFGVFLSGGVDSSLVAAMMAQESEKPIEAFSIAYGREGDFMDESAYARAVAERYGMRHHMLTLDSEDLLRDLDRVAWFLDEPCGDPAAFLTLSLAEFTRRRVTMTLSGVGADELFGGYRRYLAVRWLDRYLRIPAPLRDGLIRPLVERLPESRTQRLSNYARMARKFVSSVQGDLASTWSRTISYLPDYPGAIFGGAFRDVSRASYRSEHFDACWRRAEAARTPIERVMYVDLRTYLVDQLLLIQDKMTMAASLEARLPFLDHRLVELAARIPVERKIEGNRLKAPLKRIAERYVPRDCIYRAKKGFVAPVEAWLRGPLKEQVEDLLSPQRVRERGIFEPAFVEWMKREFYAGGRDLGLQMYKALLLETWLRLYLDGGGRRFAGALSASLPPAA